MMFSPGLTCGALTTSTFGHLSSLGFSLESSRSRNSHTWAGNTGRHNPCQSDAISKARRMEMGRDKRGDTLYYPGLPRVPRSQFDLVAVTEPFPVQMQSCVLLLDLKSITILIAGLLGGAGLRFMSTPRVQDRM